MNHSLKFVLLVATTIFSVCRPALADYMDARKLAASCGGNRQLVLAYIAGIYDRSEHAWSEVREFKTELLLMQGLMNAHRAELEPAIDHILRGLKGYCAPANVSLGVLGDTFCRYVLDKAATSQDSGSELFNKAMKESWPCP